MASSADATAYNAINQARKRAGLPDLQKGLSQTAFRDSVVVERGWEFAVEVGIRWFDLMRTETPGKANALRDPSEVPLVGKPDGTSHAFYWNPVPINR